MAILDDEYDPWLRNYMIDDDDQGGGGDTGGDDGYGGSDPLPNPVPQYPIGSDFVQGQDPPDFNWDPDPYTGSDSYDIPPVPVFDAPDFVAPDWETAMQDPGYQFRLAQGEGSLESSAAARGVLRTGGTLKDILDYGQNAASQEYANVFNRALQTYGTQYTEARDAFAPQLLNWESEVGRNRDVWGEMRRRYEWMLQQELERQRLVAGL